MSDIDNDRDTPFKPKLNIKHNAKQPLKLEIIKDDFLGTESYCHPYKFEIENFEIPDWQLKPQTEILYPSLNNVNNLLSFVCVGMCVCVCVCVCVSKQKIQCH